VLRTAKFLSSRAASSRSIKCEVEVLPRGLGLRQTLAAMTSLRMIRSCRLALLMAEEAEAEVEALLKGLQWLSQEVASEVKHLWVRASLRSCPSILRWHPTKTIGRAGLKTLLLSIKLSRSRRDVGGRTLYQILKSLLTALMRLLLSTSALRAIASSKARKVSSVTCSGSIRKTVRSPTNSSITG